MLRQVRAAALVQSCGASPAHRRNRHSRDRIDLTSCTIDLRAPYLNHDPFGKGAPARADGHAQIFTESISALASL
jgi:hypothetical protein